MSEALVLVVLLVTNEGDPTTGGLIAATRRALGPDAIVLADTSDDESDASALAIGERVKARAVARVSWADGSHERARLRVHVAPSGEWADDELTFAPHDAASEKGRTLGYALASMVQRVARPPPVGDADGRAPAATVEPREQPTTEPARAEPARSALDVFAQANGALGGGATSLGGSGGARWWPFARVGIRAAAGGRTGTLSAADATTTTLFASAGPSYRVPVTSTLELGARADVIVLRHAVTRSELVETTRARWLGAVGLMLEASWSLGRHAGVIAAAGAELAFGTTAVSVGGAPSGDLPPARAVTELGLRFRF
ncbi:MAG: hypothetical protein KF894_27530 [Labilithrix sp.]|nr:hypothetical protein [Labilithrix sp.]